MSMINERDERDEFTKQIDILFAQPTGLDKWCWLRRRASKLMECENPGLEEIGSSDVSCRLYELWRERYRLTGTAAITDDLGWDINGQVKEYM